MPPEFQIAFSRHLAAHRRRADFGDAVLFLYVVAFVRQYAWLVAGNWPAWALTLLASTLIWFFYVATKETDEEVVPTQFWPVVALPLLVVYGMRVSFPDVSFDVLNYHILHAERALRGTLFLPGDFFPTPAPFNPTPDILNGITRHLLGYRLGTFINYLALIWTGTILNRMLRAYFPGARLRCAGVLLILFTEHMLFEINNYMVDLLALPLLLEATRLAVSTARVEHETRRAARLALLLGACTAFKLSNLCFAIPLVLVYAFNLYFAPLRLCVERILTQRRKGRDGSSITEDGARASSPRLWKILLVAALAFVAPLLPFTVYIYRLTGSPVFPLYNKIFKSPYWQISNVFDPRWGPNGWSETLVWPALIFFRPERLSEIGVYTGRLSIGFILAPLCFLLARGDRAIRALCFITLLGALLWSAGSGYIRYALYLELTSGILLLWMAHDIWRRSARRSSTVQIALSYPLLIILLAQFCFASADVCRYEWSMRPSFFTKPRAFLHESKRLFRDRDLTNGLSPHDRESLARVDVWVASAYKTSTFEALLKPDAPVIGVRMPQFFLSRESRAMFKKALRAAEGQRIYTLSDADQLFAMREALGAEGLTSGETQTISLPYFSDEMKLDLLLIEVLPVRRAGTSAGQTPTRNQPLPLPAFTARLNVPQPPSTLRAGQKESIRVMLKNESDMAWPGQQPEWKYQLTVANRWLDAGGIKVNDLDGRAILTRDLAPGEETELPLTITAPSAPGEYILEVDAVQEGVAWFSDHGSETYRLKLKVEP